MCYYGQKWPLTARDMEAERRPRTFQLEYTPSRRHVAVIVSEVYTAPVFMIEVSYFPTDHPGPRLLFPIQGM
jgi:hypothetical protein